MHFSILTVLAAGSFRLTSTWAAPPNPPPLGIADTVDHPNPKGMLHWTPAGNGRTTTIPSGLVSYAYDQLATGSSQKLRARGGPKADVGEFTNIGQTAGYAASYACEQSGAYGISSTIEGYATDASSYLVS